MEVLVLVLSFVVLLVIGVPIAFSIGIAGILTMLMSIDTMPALTTYAQRMATGLDSFALLAIPFFVLAGGMDLAVFIWGLFIWKKIPEPKQAPRRRPHPA